MFSTVTPTYPAFQSRSPHGRPQSSSLLRVLLGTHSARVAWWWRTVSWLLGLLDPGGRPSLWGFGRRERVFPMRCDRRRKPHPLTPAVVSGPSLPAPPTPPPGACLLGDPPPRHLPAWRCGKRQEGVRIGSRVRQETRGHRYPEHSPTARRDRRAPLCPPHRPPHRS